MGRSAALSRERIVEGAVRVADAGGLAAVTMRSVGRELGVEAMSLYHHIPNKEAVLDALAEFVIAKVELPPDGAPWRSAMADRARSARSALAQHPWAIGLQESRRSPSAAHLTHHNAVLRCLREAGFSVPMATHAFSAIDSYVYGFVLTEVNLPFSSDDGESADDFVESIGSLIFSGDYPFLAENVEHHISGGDFAYGDEFEFGLELLLDGLAGRFEERGI